MHDIFRNGGLGSYPTAFFGLLLLVIAIRYAIKPEARWIPLQIALGITTVAVGAASFVTGVIVTSHAIAGEAAAGWADATATASRVGMISAIGVGEALNNLAIAFALVAFASLAATIGVARTKTELTAAHGTVSR